MNLIVADAPREDAVCDVFWEYTLHDVRTRCRDVKEIRIRTSLIGESVHAPAGLYEIKGELSSTLSDGQSRV